MAFRWRADNGPTLNAGLVAACDFKRIRISIARKPYILVIFQGGGGGGGGGGGPDPLWIRTWWHDHRWRSTRIWFYIDCHYHILKNANMKGVCERAEHVSRHKNTWICIWSWNTATSRWTNTETYRCSYKDFKWSKHSKNLSCGSFYNA